MLKDTRIFDMFTFFEETDLLEIRLKYLSDLVDYFVIVESNRTFSGHLKPYNLEANWDRFKKWKKQIIYLQIEQSTDGLEFRNVHSYDPTNGPFQLEHQMRNSFSLVNHMIKDTDLVMIGDLDEIPDSSVLKTIIQTNTLAFMPKSLQMSYHAGLLNNVCVYGSDVEWNGTVVSSGRTFKMNTPQEFRDKRNIIPHYFKAGYHFTYMNGIEAIKRKIRSFAHTEFNRPDVVDDSLIQQRISNGEDVLGRSGIKYKLVDPGTYFPEKLYNIIREYPHLLNLNTDGK